MMRFTVLSTLVATASAARIGLLRIEAPDELVSGSLSVSTPRVVLRSLFEDDVDMAFRELFTVGRGGSMSLSLSFSMPQFSMSFSMPNLPYYGNAVGPQTLAPVAAPISTNDESTLVVDGKGFMGFESMEVGVQMALAVIFLAALSVGAVMVVRKRQMSKGGAVSVDTALEESPSVFDEESLTESTASKLSIQKEQI